jgi:M6 family metalloprotease-like protein
MKPIPSLSGHAGLSAVLLAVLWGLQPAAEAATLADFGYQRRATLYQVGSQRSLMVILATFTDGTLAHSSNYYHSLVFNSTQQPRSVNGYFQEISNQRFLWSLGGMVSISVPPSDRFTNVFARTGENGNLADQLYTSNLVHRAMSSGQFDFCAYDANHDGYLVPEELTIAIISNDGGGGSRPTGPVRPPGSSCTWQGTVALQDHQGELLTLCHELAHQLGTLDLYGDECHNQLLTLMDCTITLLPDDPTTYHLDPWHKLQYGWCEPRIRSLAGGGVETLPAAQMLDASAPLILYQPARGIQEFFLLEYRTTNSPNGPGYDANTAGSGLVIWHVQQDTNKDLLWLAEAALPNNAQNDWWYCDKCKGMHFMGTASSPGPCPAGDHHNAHQPGARDYRVRLNDPAAPGQHGWSWCRKCQGLFLGLNQSTSHCPASGTHDGSQSGDYALNNGTHAQYEDTSWRWCKKCQGLFHGPSQAKSRCPDPAGGTHDGSSSGTYGVPMRMIHYALAAEGAPDLIYAGIQLWVGGTSTPVLRWYDGSLVGARISVRPFMPGAGSLMVEWGEQDSWVDFNFSGTEYGTFSNPFNTLAEGVGAAFPNGILHIKMGHSPVVATLSKPMQIQAYGGPVTLGR